MGNALFAYVKGMYQDPDTVGAVQAICLAVVTLGTLLYTVNKGRIHTYSVQNKELCVAIGSGLGCMSSFMWIGGGPINMIVLYFFSA